MNKAELVRSMAEKSGLTQKDTTASLEAFISAVQETLANGESITLVGFGTFEIQERAARLGRNPSNGQEIQIAASKLPKFKPGKGLKESIPQPKAPTKTLKKPKTK